MLAVPLLARALPLGPSSFIPDLQVELLFPIVVPPSHDVADCAILLFLPHVYQIQRVPCLVLLLALPPFMQERNLTKHKTLIKSRVDRRVRLVGIGFPAKLLVIEFPWHGGGAGGTYPNNRLLENA